VIEVRHRQGNAHGDNARAEPIAEKKTIDQAAAVRMAGNGFAYHTVRAARTETDGCFERGVGSQSFGKICSATALRSRAMTISRVDDPPVLVMMDHSHAALAVLTNDVGL